MTTAPRKRSRMTGSELAKVVVEFDDEFVVDTFGSPPPEVRARWDRAKPVVVPPTRSVPRSTRG